MIDVKEAKRLDGWIQEAVQGGATLLCGGKREGAMLEATLLENVDRSPPWWSRGSVRAGRDPLQVHRFNAALAEVNDSASSGSRPASSRATCSRCSTPGTISTSAASSSTTCRATASTTCPMAASRISGLGREGVRFAMEDMTEIRNLVIRRGEYVMSSIPSSAMPHAGKANDNETQNGSEGQNGQKEGRGASIKKGATKLKDTAKANPKTAIAAGAAVVAAAVGAAALGARKKSATAKKPGTAKKTSSSKSADAKGNGSKSKSSS
jgi:hypothetical protein